MTQQRFRSCFISAPFGVDTSVLRTALERRGIEWTDQTSVEPGSTWSDLLDEHLSKSDFVCAVLPKETTNQGNVLFELGIAYAKRKPILAFVSSPPEILADMQSLTYVRSDPTMTDAVYRALDTFLEHAEPTRRRQARRPISKIRRTNPARFAEKNAEFAFERKTADLLQQAGFIVSESKAADQGADLAVWIDELEHSLGNPLLIQVKVGNLSTRSLQQAALELRNHAEKTHSRCALLIYWDQSNREFSSDVGGWPLVLQLSGPTLETLVSQGSLVQKLVEMRNIAVHGGA